MVRSEQFLLVGLPKRNASHLETTSFLLLLVRHLLLVAWHLLLLASCYSHNVGCQKNHGFRVDFVILHLPCGVPCGWNEAKKAVSATFAPNLYACNTCFAAAVELVGWKKQQRSPIQIGRAPTIGRRDPRHKNRTRGFPTLPSWPVTLPEKKKKRGNKSKPSQRPKTLFGGFTSSRSSPNPSSDAESARTVQAFQDFHVL